MKNNIINKLKKCRLDDLKTTIKQMDFEKLSFNELVHITGDMFNEVYHQLQPIRDEMNRRYLKMKEQENLKKAS